MVSKLKSNLPYTLKHDMFGHTLSSSNKRQTAKHFSFTFPISLYNNRALRVKEVKIASKWPRPSSHHRVKLGISRITMVVIICTEKASYQIKFWVSKYKSIKKAYKNTWIKVFYLFLEDTMLFGISHRFPATVGSLLWLEIPLSWRICSPPDRTLYYSSSCSSTTQTAV